MKRVILYILSKAEKDWRFHEIERSFQAYQGVEGVGENYIKYEGYYGNYVK